MTWSDVFPILSDELFDAYLAEAPKKFRKEAAGWFAEQRTINPRPVRHIVSVCLFWKNIRSHQPDIVIRDRADFMAAEKSRKLLRFDPWSTYVRPVLEGAYRLHAAWEDVAFRVFWRRIVTRTAGLPDDDFPAKTRSAKAQSRAAAQSA